MLAAFPTGQAQAEPTGVSQDTPLSSRTWVDLLDPTDAERDAFERTFDLRVPSREALSEIEATSRLQIDGETLYLTAPLILPSANGPWVSAPAGFVLAKTVLLTVRSAQSPAFDNVIKELGPAEKFKPAFAFVRIIEELVDGLADLLEVSGHDLDEASHAIFRQQQARRLSHETRLLRQLMIHTGRTSERMARIHYSLVCLDRMAKFTIDRGRDWIGSDIAVRLQAVSSDITSLVQFAEGLVSRVQLLQDAATGIINIDQNDVMKVLTIASVVGIPPVLIAGIYGMNFKGMPEYNWAWGYPYALALIVVTALLPLIWFKWKDWI
ncbi:MAG: CorA family divalent cation transporter [Xanthobacteraceae bacterium]